ncbi:hypothetical protein TNCV_3194781 [Trichonephila clavipes]|uniref:Uncharacterized protein n=1 Tax=Trichonephila clavipes TaxID=2585209 RepID=A0A8X6RHP3_TRICX|nr:hypothetical protein TNCV_3194781 [Trichonephila clavipes]
MVANSARTAHVKSGLLTWRVTLNVGIVAILREKTDFFPEEDTTKSYSGVEPIRLQAEGPSHHTGWATVKSMPQRLREVIR